MAENPGMAMETIAVAGGNGKIGSAVLAELGDHGYRTVNLSRGRRKEDHADEYRRTDLLDAGEVYGSLASSDADAVVHMGTIPAPTSSPGHVCYESNVVTTWHVLEAAHELGLESVVLPSSINAVGAGYQDAPAEIEYLPVDEDHPLTPRDPYALGKEAIERAGAGHGRLPDAPSIVALRYPWVATTEELRQRFASAERTPADLPDDWADTARDSLFSYLHLADAATIARRAVEADVDEFETFWAVAADTSVDGPTAALVERYYPDAAVRRPLEERESLVSIRKARERLDWEPEHSWTDL